MSAQQYLVATDDIHSFRRTVNNKIAEGWRVIPQTIHQEIKDTRGGDWWNGKTGGVTEAYVCLMECDLTEQQHDVSLPDLAPPAAPS